MLADLILPITLKIMPHLKFVALYLLILFTSNEKKFILLITKLAIQEIITGNCGLYFLLKHSLMSNINFFCSCKPYQYSSYKNFHKTFHHDKL